MYIMKEKNTTSLLTIGVFFGFVFGFFCSGMIGAAGELSAQRYLYYKMYRLAALVFQWPLFKWMAICVITAVVLFILSKALEKTNKTMVILLAGCLVFLPAAWAVNHYWLTYTKFHPVSLSVDLGLFVFVIFIIWLLGKIFGTGRWESMLHRLNGKRTIKRAAAAAVLLLLLLNAGVYVVGTSGEAKGPNIVYIVIDTLRYDSLGCYGYQRDTSPGIDRLAGEGVLFKRAYSSAPWTKPSVASLFSGLSPNVHRAVNARGAIPEAVPLTAEILKNDGYRTFFFSGKNNFIGKRFHFHQGFDHYTNASLKARKLTDRVLSVLEENREENRDSRFFAYVHYMDVHLPYGSNEFNFFFTPEKKDSPFVPGGFKHKFVKRKTAAGKLSGEDKAYIKAMYDGQVRYVDKHIERIVSWLKEKGIFDNTLVVVTADHGEEFWDHGNFEHGHTLYDELIHVPLLFAGNGLSHEVVDRPVRLIDLLPTVLKMAGIKSGGYRLEGIELFDKSNDRKPVPPIFAMNTLYGPEKYGLIRGSRKLIVNTTDMYPGKDEVIGYSSGDPVEFYDLSADPGETENLADTEIEDETFAGLQRMLTEFIEKEPTFKSKQVKLDKKTRDELKTLGYL